MTEIQVGLGDRAYPIIIEQDILAQIGGYLQKLNIAKKYFIVADSHVADIYGRTLKDSLAEAGLPAKLVTFARGEESKHLGTIADLSSKLAQLGTDRKDALIALGGGVTGDITGFLAASYMRGIPFIQVPTTLLAQVDSSVGGKTGVDIPEGKNLVGAFYQPQAVYIDTAVLKTLPAAELLNGLAEIIKYSIIWDADFFEFLTEGRTRILALEPEILKEVIARCCSIKAKVVEADEREADLRRILNYGHTIGHAIEAASNYTMAHGAAVAIGMVMAGRLAVHKELLNSDEAGRIHKLITDYGMQDEIPVGMDRNRIKKYLKTDKKAVSGRPFFVLPTTIGKVVITDDVDEKLIDEVIM